MLDAAGNEINSYNVGSIPGDFSAWEMCHFSGDAIQDEILNIYDVVFMVENIIYNHLYECESDSNADGSINILDITLLVNSILG